jgi:hypothetical protein
MTLTCARLSADLSDMTHCLPASLPEVTGKGSHLMRL